MKKTPLLVRFDPEVHAKLKVRAKQRKIKMAELVRRLVDNYFA